MSDLEQRLSQMLAERAEGAPVAEGLAGAARSRHRRRSVTRYAGAGAAAVVLAVGVPIALSGLRADSEAPPAGRGDPEVLAIPADWKFESYRNVEFAVPPDWGYGSLDDWCSNGGELEGSARVERPGAAANLILCPSSGFGARIGPAPADPPKGAFVREAEAGGVTLSVVAQTKDVADTVAGSLREIPGDDFHGCAPSRDVPSLGAMPESSDLGRKGVASICHYEVGIEGPNLISSEGVTEEDAESFWLGLESAEPGTGPDSGPDICIHSPETEAVLVLTGAEDYAWVHYTGCDGHGVDVGGTTYKLNAQVTYWTLPRGGFAVDGSVPIPKELRP